MTLQRPPVSRSSIALAALLAGACSAAPIPYSLVATAPNTLIDSTVRVAIKTQAEWSGYAVKLQGAEMHAAVDFDNDMLLAVGPAAGASDSVRIIHIQDTGNYWLVTVVSYFACLPLAVSTEPAAAVRVRRTDVEVRFVSEGEFGPGCAEPGRGPVMFRRP